MQSSPLTAMRGCKNHLGKNEKETPCQHQRYWRTAAKKIRLRCEKARVQATSLELNSSGHVCLRVQARPRHAESGKKHNRFVSAHLPPHGKLDSSERRRPNIHAEAGSGLCRAGSQPYSRGMMGRVVSFDIACDGSRPARRGRSGRDDSSDVTRGGSLPARRIMSGRLDSSDHTRVGWRLSIRRTVEYRGQSLRY